MSSNNDKLEKVTGGMNMTITLERDMSITEIANYLNVTIECLRSYNNFVNEQCIPAGTVVFYNDRDITVW